MVVVASMMGAFGWMFGRTHGRKPFPEYTSPNSWSRWMTINNEALALQADLVETFNLTQRDLYKQYREKVLEAEREKPWQGEYSKHNPLQNISK